MSSKPNPQGVAEVLQHLELLEQLAPELERAEREAQRLPQLRERKRALLKGLSDLLEGMDLDSSGNAGWPGRMMWFLSEMRRQVQRDK